MGRQGSKTVILIVSRFRKSQKPSCSTHTDQAAQKAGATGEELSQEQEGRTWSRQEVQGPQVNLLHSLPLYPCSLKFPFIVPNFEQHLNCSI